MRSPKPTRSRPELRLEASLLLARLTRDGFPRSRHVVHALVLVLALVAAVAGSRVRTASQFDALTDAFSFETASSHRSSFANSARNGAESLVKAPSVETQLMNRPRRDVSLHFVRDGENIYILAKRFNVDVETIASANFLDIDDPLRAGQLLIVPPVKGVLHVVRSGDTVDRIAARYQANPQSIVEFNQLSNASQLVVGERLVVPGGHLGTARAQVASRGEERRVPQGGIAPASLPAQEASSKPTAEPEPTSEPAPTPGPMRPWTYVVQDGDSVLSLAVQFGISAETIIWANGLGSSAFINIGQELVILPVSGVLHTVSEGDSLDYIAQVYQADVQAIVDANQLSDPSDITIGQELVIPGGQIAMPEEVVEEPEPEVVEGELAPADEPAVADEPASGSEPEPEVTIEPAPSDGYWDAVSVASEFLGYPYVWGGTTPNGFDCSGFIYYVFNRRLGLPVPRDLGGQYNAGMQVGYDSLAPGDIVFFRNTYKAGLSHVGIYIGGGRFIHAASEAEGVTVTSLSASYWAARYAGATRVY